MLPPGLCRSPESFSKLRSAVHSCFPFLQRLTVNLNNLSETEEDSQFFFPKLMSVYLLIWDKLNYKSAVFPSYSKAKDFKGIAYRFIRENPFSTYLSTLKSFIHSLVHPLVLWPERNKKHWRSCFLISHLASLFFNPQQNSKKDSTGSIFHLFCNFALNTWALLRTYSIISDINGLRWGKDTKHNRKELADKHFCPHRHDKGMRLSN